MGIIRIQQELQSEPTPIRTQLILITIIRQQPVSNLLLLRQEVIQATAHQETTAIIIAVTIHQTVATIIPAVAVAEDLVEDDKIILIIISSVPPVVAVIIVIAPTVI